MSAAVTVMDSRHLSRQPASSVVAAGPAPAALGRRPPRVMEPRRSPSGLLLPLIVLLLAAAAAAQSMQNVSHFDDDFFSDTVAQMGRPSGPRRGQRGHPVQGFRTNYRLPRRPFRARLYQVRLVGGNSRQGKLSVTETEDGGCYIAVVQHLSRIHDMSGIIGMNITIHVRPVVFNNSVTPWICPCKNCFFLNNCFYRVLHGKNGLLNISVL